MFKLILRLNIYIVKFTYMLLNLDVTINTLKMSNMQMYAKHGIDLKSILYKSD